ncbi:MAG: peroxide stress protein YaaA [Hornefia sp.]|nr:peroxide stress protein YaaA [Hornefia sp.]
MRIILSPAKKMKETFDGIPPEGLPVFPEETCEIIKYLKALSYDEAKKLWACSDKIAGENYSRLAGMDFAAGTTPAILAYDGIAFTYMAPGVFEYGEFDYVQEHLRILSGFYGVVKPMDAVISYRLEMQAKASIGKFRNLYEFWGDKIYKEVTYGDNVVINLASKEYSKTVEKYISQGDTFITCTFGELTESKGKEKVVQKGVYAKMARGEMVKFMAEKDVQSPEKIKKFNRLGYTFSEKFSTDTEYVFLKDQPAVKQKGKEDTEN